MHLPHLPINSVLHELKNALRSGSAVLAAPPGSGKTTLVPLALLEEPWLRGKKIIILEPRRLATRAAAARMAKLMGEPVSRSIGYQIPPKASPIRWLQAYGLYSENNRAMSWPFFQERVRSETLRDNSSMIRQRYQDGESPLLAVRIQEMFGTRKTPVICDGEIPVVLHLLSPAQRPLQVTTDLAGFWQRTYREIKKELKGRYPKHFWPDDPLAAVATRRTKKQMEKSKKQ